MSLLCTFAAAAKAVRSASSKVSPAAISSLTGCSASSEAMTVSFNSSDPRFLDCEEEAGVDVAGADVAGGDGTVGGVGRPAEVPGST